MGLFLHFFIFIYRILIPVVITFITVIESFDKRFTTHPAKHPVLGEKTFLFFIFMMLWSWLQVAIMKDEGQDDRANARNIIHLIYFFGLVVLIIIALNHLYIY
jgi:hypothetical protein